MPDFNQAKSSRGGKREGAGRKPGSLTAKTREIAERAAEEGVTPLEFMLSTLRNEELDLPARMDAAKSAAPYIHPRLSSIEANVNATINHESALAELAALDEQPE